MSEARAQFSRPAALRTWLPCNLAHVRETTLRISSFLKEQNFAVEEVQACELALVEACNNAVQYAQPGAQWEPITVDVLCDAAFVEFQVRDHTPGFEWPSRLNLPEPEQERGRGLFLIQSLMDQATYYRGQRTNCLVLQKRRAKPAPSRFVPSPSSLDQLTHQLGESEQIISDMAEELSFCYESLSAIFRCSTELGRSHDLKEFSQRLLNDLAQITSADWFLLRLLSRDGSQLEVFTSSDPRFELAPLAMTGGLGPISLELQAASGRQDVWFDGESLPKEEPLASASGAGAGLIHPFALGNQLIGTVAIGKLDGGTQFTAVHANVVHTFADFLGIQISNARFQEERVHARLVSRELEIAKNIQRSLLPKSLPEIPGFALAAFCQNAHLVGGDFYDVLKLDDHSLLLVVADVMGKGIPAAMFAAILRSLLRAVPEWTDQPDHLLARVNRLLFKELSGVDMFITTQLAYVDTTRKRIVAASAGHCPLLLAGNSNPLKVVAPEGVPLGILPDTSFGVQVEELGQNSRMLLYTDGLTESRNDKGEFFGQDRLVAWFAKDLDQPKSAEELKLELASELSGFRGTSPVGDDQTFLIMAQTN